MSENNPYQSPESNTMGEGPEFAKVEMFSMSQRIGRIRYLAYSFGAQLVLILAIAILGVILGVGGAAMGQGSETAMGVMGVISLIILLVLYGVMIFASVVLGVRRLHDLDKSGWLWLLFIVPLVNIAMAIYLLFFPGTKGPNRFGPQPEPNTTGTWIAGLAVPVFIIILGILAAVAIPAYQDYQQRVLQAQESEYNG